MFTPFNNEDKHYMNICLELSKTTALLSKQLIEFNKLLTSKQSFHGYQLTPLSSGYCSRHGSTESITMKSNCSNDSINKSILNSSIESEYHHIKPKSSSPASTSLTEDSIRRCLFREPSSISLEISKKSILNASDLITPNRILEKEPKSDKIERIKDIRKRLNKIRARKFIFMGKKTFNFMNSSLIKSNRSINSDTSN